MGGPLPAAPWWVSPSSPGARARGAAGWLEAERIGYEDFLPRSAAGIFASNLTGRGEVDASHGGAHRDADWLSGAMGRPVRVPEQVYAEQRAASLAAAALGIRGGIVVDRGSAAPAPSAIGSR